MKVLIAASEVAPIVKLGGLGDVIGSLPKALEKAGVDADVIVPFYPNAKVENLKVYKGVDLEVPFDGQNHVVNVYKTKLPNSNVDVIMLKNANYFATGGSNAFANNVTETEMFAFFDVAVVEFIKAKFNTYDVVHCNDWHTGLITHLLKEEIGSTRPATVLTIHNLSYQGLGDLDLVEEIGIVPGTDPIVDLDIADGDINMMQQGILAADFISTVSPTYAKEILFNDLGGPLSEYLQGRRGRLDGILNGIDYSQFPRSYDLNNWKEAKASAKELLQKKFKLNVTDDPMYCYIGRLDPNQKGLDILYETIPDIINSNAQLVILGTGDPVWEAKLRSLTDIAKYKGKLSINIIFDVELAQEIYAASDFIIVPSRFEPCGLIQMIGMWYGALPVVHATGGLKDTVAERKTGFLFNVYSANALQQAIENSLKAFKDKKLHSEMVKNAMVADFSWDASAIQYKALYKEVIELRQRALDLAEDLEE
ncbi:MAG: glycogen synthase [Patescibacteria group bacterium]